MLITMVEVLGATETGRHLVVPARCGRTERLRRLDSDSLFTSSSIIVL
jgi:hypothetical protein